MKQFFTFLAVELVIGLSVIFLLFAQPAYGASLTLTWTDNSDNEDGFNVERKLGQTGTFAPVGQTAADVSTFVDATVVNEQLYCYRVNAYNSSGPSPWSADGCGRDSDLLIGPGVPIVTKTVTTTTTTTTTTPTP